MRLVRRLDRKLRETRMFVRAMQSAAHPILAQIVPIRRCNLDCAYCNEYDKTSAPVPLETMLRRIDRLADLGTTIITLSGGEPTLHPDLDAIIRRIRDRGAIATLITNGLLLTPDRIRALNRAGLDYLQISIDNVAPDDVSKKSLRVLDRKLEWLARYAEFGVTINSVLGAGVRNPEDAIAVGRRARELGLHQHGRHSARSRRPASAARAGPAECLRSFPASQDRSILVRAFRSFSGEHRARTAERLALPRRRPIPVYLRGRAGALLLATAWPARHSAR